MPRGYPKKEQPITKEQLNNLIDIEKDILTHPSNDLSYLKPILESDLFSKTDIKNINEAFSIIIKDNNLSEKGRADILKNSWKINHKFKPPTAEEFLSEKWIGPQSMDLYPHVKQRFLEYFNPLTNKNKLILYCCTGWGKSTLLSMQKFYRAVLTNSLRNPKQFLKLGQSTQLKDITVSFTKATAWDLVVAPMVNILDTSPMCERLRYERDMNNPEYINSGKVLFCNMSKGNSMIRVGDVFFDVASDPMDLIGRNIISTSCTETAFLCEKMPEEQVMKLINEMLTRVYNRFGYNNPNNSIVIDSSPNTMEGQADQWIAQHKNDKDVLFINDKKWEVQPWVTPIWEKDHSKTFNMFIGTSSKPARVVTDEEATVMDNDLIMKMPIDLLELAQDNPSKILRDFGACPTSGSDEKLINNFEIFNKLFVPNITNEYFYIYASYLSAPEGLLWSHIKNICFNYTGVGNLYELKRAQKSERFLSVDLAEKHDMASISMCHIECNNKGEKIYVLDFTLPIMSKKNDKINLDAFKYLIWDLKRYGQVNLKHISFDQFQSSTSQQFLERLGFEVERLSVDITTEPYLSMLSYLQQNRIKCGKNLILKNNLKSLILTNKGHHGKGNKLVVDHCQGEWCDLQNRDWEHSKAGYFGKDVSDSFTACITLADKYGTLTTEYLYNYNDEEIKECKQFEQKKIQTNLKKLGFEIMEE